MTKPTGEIPTSSMGHPIHGGRNPGDHPIANPQREQLGAALAETLRRGYTLLSRDIDGVLPFYGYSPRSLAVTVTDSPGFRGIVAKNGAKLIRHQYRNRIIYRDGNLPPDETDLEATKARIDGAYRHSAKAKL